jgi:putative endopeptidase
MKFAALLSVSALALSLSDQTPSHAAPAAQKVSSPSGSWGVDLSAGDRSVKPGESFYDYVNGAWLKSAEIAPDQQMTGPALDLHNKTQAQLRSLIEDSARNPTTETAKKLGAVYASFMDEARLEQLDDAPLQRDLAAVKAISTKTEMVKHMGESVEGFGSGIFGIQVIPDLKGPKLYTPALYISGMSLPTRDYYLDAKFKPQRDAYAAHLARTLKLASWPDADAAAAAILAFETKMAEASWTMTEMRDPVKGYHPMTPAELKAYAPGFEWETFFTATRAPAFNRIIVSSDTAIAKVAKLFAETTLDTLKAWQAFRTTNSASTYLSKRFVDNAFEFTRAVSGQRALRPRWQRGVSLVDGTLGEAVGQEYVRRHFPASSKKMMEGIVANLHKAMRARIEDAKWMTPDTKAAALIKLSKQRVKVGYPSKWQDYSALQVDPADLYGNVERASAFAARFQLDRIGKPADREEWSMTPQTVNAYFSPIGNEIVFPAAMLQSPYFDPNADAAVNYGAIGAVIGHEVTHAFDDTGRQFDQDGELRDWWQAADATRFTGEAAKLAAQYDTFDGLPGAKVNGKLTLGENIGDQGGLKIALDAYRATLKGKPAPVIDGYTGDQRFFLSFGQSWKAKIRDEAMKMILVSDVHSPARWRVDGTLRNIDDWYTAFNVKPGDKLYLAPADRVRVW